MNEGSCTNPEDLSSWGTHMEGEKELHPIPQVVLEHWVIGVVHTQQLNQCNKPLIEARDAAQFVECLLGRYKTLTLIPALAWRGSISHPRSSRQV